MELRVKLTAKDIFVFSLIHFYKSFSGVVSVLCTAITLGVAAFTWPSQSAAFRLVLLFSAVFVALCQPVVLYSRAVKQARDAEAGKEIYYRLDYNGIKVQQGREKATVYWNQVVKAGRVPGIYVLYLNHRRAYLLPDWALVNGKREQLTKTLRQYIPAEKRRGI